MVSVSNSILSIPFYFGIWTTIKRSYKYREFLWR